MRDTQVGFRAAGSTQYWIYGKANYGENFGVGKPHLTQNVKRKSVIQCETQK